MVANRTDLTEFLRGEQIEDSSLNHAREVCKCKWLWLSHLKAKIMNLFMRDHREITQKSSKISRKLRRFCSWGERASPKTISRTLSVSSPKLLTKRMLRSASVVFSEFFIWADEDNDVELFAPSYFRSSYFGRMTSWKYSVVISIRSRLSTRRSSFHGMFSPFFRRFKSASNTSKSYTSEKKFRWENTSIDRLTSPG